ncbi:MAG: hypothetical protein E7317_09485, partial [Clostridiales bacterium]|nr:hypothetical protein [Clostridiales bacterium]
QAKLNENAAGEITYASANTKIAKVDAETGKVTGVAVGKTTVTASTYVPGVEAQIEVEVLPACTFVKLPYSTVTIGVGDTLQLKPQIDEGVATTFSYASQKSKYAKVSDTGLITAVRRGTTTVTVTTGNGKTCKLTVKVVRADTTVSFAESDVEVSVGATKQLKWSFTETDVASVKFAVEDESIASVDKNGVVTGLKMGKTRLKVTAYNGKYALCELTVIGKPESIAISFPKSISAGESVTAGVSFAPEGTSASVTWSVSSGDAIKVSKKGVVTGLKKGKAVLCATAGKLKAEKTVEVLPAPTTLSFAKSKYTVDIGETLKLKPVVDEGSAVSFHWDIATEGFFTIDASGVVHPEAIGKSKVTCSTSNGLSATITVEVADLYTPTDVAITNAPAMMEVGDTWTPKIAVKPSTASASMKWQTGDPNILTLDSKTNTFYALSFGYVTVRGTCTRDSSLTVSVRICVDNPDLEMTIPDRRTTTAEIQQNLSKIRAVRDTALKVVKKLYTAGTITSSEYDARKTAVERAFSMYEFPWMTDTREPYWKAANSEDGAKDFKPGTVYYGLPYTQNNRVNSAESVVNQGYYKDTGKGYYKLNGSKFSDRQYPGNDCSAFASISLWGKGSDRASDTTRAIGKASYYVTINDWTALRTGDLINKSGAHVVVFLYYTDAAKTQFMLIEQGGGEAAINTVSCNVRTVAAYRDAGYSIRRPK